MSPHSNLQRAQQVLTSRLSWTALSPIPLEGSVSLECTHTAQIQSLSSQALRYCPLICWLVNRGVIGGLLQGCGELKTSLGHLIIREWASFCLIHTLTVAVVSWKLCAGHHNGEQETAVTQLTSAFSSQHSMKRSLNISTFGTSMTKRIRETYTLRALVLLSTGGTKIKTKYHTTQETLPFLSIVANETNESQKTLVTRGHRQGFQFISMDAAQHVLTLFVAQLCSIGWNYPHCSTLKGFRVGVMLFFPQTTLCTTYL